MSVWEAMDAANRAFDERAEQLGHKLVRDDDGEVNHFAYESGFHNGPACAVCKDSWCYHCGGPDKIKPCDGGAAFERMERAQLARLQEKYA